VGAVVAWLVTNPDAAEKRVVPDGRVIDSQAICGELALVPDWPG
jgi:hypothetical protein